MSTASCMKIPKCAQSVLRKQTQESDGIYCSAGFGVGAMIHAVLHFGMYFELRSTSKCDDILVAITPLAQAAFIITQMIFIFSDNNKVTSPAKESRPQLDGWSQCCSYTGCSLKYKVWTTVGWVATHSQPHWL